MRWMPPANDVNERLNLTRFQRLNLTHPWRCTAPSRAALTWRVRLGVLLVCRLFLCAAFALREAIGRIAGLNDCAVVGDTIQQGGCHLGIPEDGDPFTELQVSDYDDTGLLCRYAVTRETFPLTSQIWEKGDVHEQRPTRDSAQIADTAIRRRDWPCR